MEDLLNWNSMLSFDANLNLKLDCAVELMDTSCEDFRPPGVQTCVSQMTSSLSHRATK